jgi:hypothetical protein
MVDGPVLLEREAEFARLEVLLDRAPAGHGAVVTIEGPTGIGKTARPLDFFHPLVGEAVYAGVGLGAWRLAHQRAATILDRADTGTDRVAARPAPSPPGSYG